MDQILLPLAHVPLSHDTVISSQTRLRLGTTLVISLMTHMTGYPASATLPPGYQFQNAYLNTGNQPCVPCPNRRTTTQTYTYELPPQNEIQFYSRNYGQPANQIQIDSRKFVLFDLF